MGAEKTDVFGSILKELLNPCTISETEELPQYMFYNLVVRTFVSKTNVFVDAIQHVM